MNQLNKALMALMAGASVFGLVYGLAASLTVTTNTLGASQNVVAACQAGAMVATYSPSYSAAIPGYVVTGVTVTGMASTCYGKNFRVTVTGAANALLGEGTGTTPAAGTTFTAAFTAVSAATVTGVAVVLEG